MAMERSQMFQRRQGLTTPAATTDWELCGAILMMMVGQIYLSPTILPQLFVSKRGKGAFRRCQLHVRYGGQCKDGGEMAGMGVAVCDFNHTGRFSIHVTNFEDQSNSLYRNDGQMNFTDVANLAGIEQISVPYMGWGTGCVDFNNDGWADLFVVNGHVYPQVDSLQTGSKYRQRKLVFQNQKDGTFRDVSDVVGPAVTIPQPSRGAAFGDLFNDGKIDAVVENIDGLPMILRNEDESHNHWVTVQLVGSNSNRLGLGAKLRIIAGGVSQIEEVRSGGSYLSQNDRRVHFGLGSAKEVNRMEIRWPSGAIQIFQDLPCDRFYVAKEGERNLTQDPRLGAHR